MSIKVNDLRPDSLKATQQAAYKKDAEKLLANRAAFLHSACPACGWWDASVASIPADLHYEECKQCGTLYASPRPMPGHLEAYGFEVLEWTTPGEMDAELLGLPAHLQSAIRRLKISSHMQVIARKVR